MNFLDRFVGHPPVAAWTVLPLFLLSVLTLVFSMILASRLAGGIDFGPAHIVIAKGAGLLAVVTLLNFLDCGVLLAGPVWFFGLMFLFRLDTRETRLLTRINWGANLVWKLLLTLWLM
jgi:protein-S-isoprenylcysteine O-methyltransferase Ste14